MNIKSCIIASHSPTPKPESVYKSFSKFKNSKPSLLFVNGDISESDEIVLWNFMLLKS